MLQKPEMDNTSVVIQMVYTLFCQISLSLLVLFKQIGCVPTLLSIRLHLVIGLMPLLLQAALVIKHAYNYALGSWAIVQVRSTFPRLPALKTAEAESTYSYCTHMTKHEMQIRDLTIQM